MVKLRMFDVLPTRAMAVVIGAVCAGQAAAAWSLTVRVSDHENRTLKLGGGFGSDEGGISGASPVNLCNQSGVARHGMPAPGAGGGTLSPLTFVNAASINRNGRIAFFSQVDGSARNQGIFVADHAGVSAIVRGCGAPGGDPNPSTCGDPSPIGGTFSGFFAGTFFCPDINDAGDVLFLADVNGGSAPRGLFLYRASTQQIIKVAAPGDASPLGGTLGAVGPGSMNNNGRIVFLATQTGGATDSNVLMWNNGVVTKVAAMGDPAPGGGTFSLLGTESAGFQDGSNIPVGPLPDINDSNQITFRAITSSPAGRGIIVSSGGTHQWYVRAGDITPVGGAYFDMQAASINNNGEIAFFADFQPVPGEFDSAWFAGSPGNWRKVLRFLDIVNGGQCIGLAFSRNPMQTINDDGDVYVWCNVLLSGTEREHLVLFNESNQATVVAQQGQPTPIGGIYGFMQSWPSLAACRGVASGTTPGAPDDAFNAHFTFSQCKPGDINGSCTVNVDDLLGVINAWGPCPVGPACPADITGNGVVNVDDLLAVISNWG